MKERPIESILPAEIKAKAREYAKTIEHSYADTREELEEDVAEAWAKGFIFCLQGKVEAIYKDKEETIQKLTDENKKLEVDVEYYTQRLELVLSDLDKNKIGRTAYIKGIRTMANALKTYDRVNGTWTDYFEHTVDKVLKNLLKEVHE